MAMEEEKSNSQRLQEQLNQLNTKMRSVRRDKEDAESEVESMRSKVRQLRSQVEEAEENASSLQAQITKLRAASRKAAAKVSEIPSSSSLLFHFLRSLDGLVIVTIVASFPGSSPAFCRI